MPFYVVNMCSKFKKKRVSKKTKQHISVHNAKNMHTIGYACCMIHALFTATHALNTLPECSILYNQLLKQYSANA